MRSVFVLYLALALIPALPTAAAPAPAPARVAAFDPARIHADYQAGDFEKVIRALESFRESGRRCRKADSVFLEKHLAVVYAADPKTRERGRYHMLRMLSLEPEADLLDMFVGEEVDGIFEKVRKESLARRLALEGARAAQTPQAPKRAATRTEAGTRSAANPRHASVPVPRPAPPAARSAVPAAGAPRPAFPDAGPVPRLKPWNLEDAPAPRRSPRKPGASRAAAAEAPYSAPSGGDPSASSRLKAKVKPPRVAMPKIALPAWDLDRTASSASSAVSATSGPAMGVLPAAGGMRPSAGGPTWEDGTAAEDIGPRLQVPKAVSAAANPDGAGADRPATGPESRPGWAGKRLLVGGTAVAAVLGLTAYYVGSQDWSEPASKNRTYGVAAKPNGN